MEFSATGVVNHNNTEYDSLNSSINTKWLACLFCRH